MTGKGALHRTLTAVFVGLFALSCGGSNGTTGTTGGTTVATCLSDSNALLATAEAPMHFALPGPAFNMKSNAGKTIWIVTPTISNEINAAALNGMKQAAAAAGLKVHAWDGQNSVATENQGVSEAVAQHAAGIILESLAPQVVADPLAKAIAAKIPVVNWLDDDVGAPLGGVNARVTAPFGADGKVMAAYVLAHSNCSTDTLMVYAAVAPQHVAIQKQFNDYITKECSSCQATSYPVNPATMATASGPYVVNAIQRDSKIKWVADAFDFVATFFVPAIQQSGLKGVSAIGHDGNASNLDWIKTGQVQVADMALPDPAYQGWVSVDLLGRLMAGQPADSFTLPAQLVDSTNVSQLGSSFGDYQSAFKQNWGI